MGIKNLHKFLRGKCPEVFVETPLSNFQYSKVIVDFSLYLFKYITIFGEDGWMSAMINLISCFRRNEIHAVFAFDGQAPPEKQQEQQDRREKRNKLDERISTLEKSLEKAKSTGEIDDVLKELSANLNSPTLKQKRLLSGVVKDSASSINLNLIEQEILRIKRQSVHLSSKHFDDAKKIFDLLGVPYVQAPLEGENLCADLCIKTQVECVVTEDSDVFAYGCPVLLSKINTATDSCVVIRLEDILKSLELTQAEFLDFCIMCSCDYNQNIPGIGPEKAFKLIKNYRTIEKIEESGVDVKILNHLRVRELFTEFAPFEERIPYCKEPAWQIFEKFLFENNVRLNMKKLKKDFEPPGLVFSD